ncbi:Phosphoinositide phosphatase sac1 [Cryptotrichosporon argae]
MATFNTLPLHETLNLYVSPTSYVFEPASSTLATHGIDGPTLVNEKDVRESLHIDRKTGRMALNGAAQCYWDSHLGNTRTLTSESSDIPLGKEKVITCYGIIGILSLATTDFLIVVTARTPSCRLLSHPIYLATDFRLLPLSPLSTSSAILDHPVEKELVALVEQGLKSGRLWFSYGWDLTNTLQRQKEAEDGGKGLGKEPMWKRADERFFWNKYLMEPLIDATENQGVDVTVELRSANINNRDVLFCLTARRSRHRAGTRYFSRGINRDGEVSNFNETEQIVLLDPLPEAGQAQAIRGRVDGRERLSFVQTRGSVPIFWAEVNNLRYKPDLQIMDIPETTQALKNHLYKMINEYQSLYLVNLVNQKGYEQPVKEAFERGMATVSASDPLIAERAHYVYFDFHAECRKMRFDRISVLIDRLAAGLDGMGWYHAVTPAAMGFASGSSSASAQVLRKQTGVVRSNCMDCLDRTNVVQSALGKWALNKQLRDAGVLSHKETIDDHEAFMVIFRNVWADHADTISTAYAGTGALKTDFTRTGKRTREGYLADGYNSVMRYIRNNFFDGDRQDAFDLLTGAWVAKKGGIPPLTDTRPLVMRSMPYVLAFALTMVFAAITLPRTSDLSIYSFLLLWFFLAFVSGSYIWGNGTAYVSWPRLNPPLEILSYRGEGFRSLQRGRGLSLASVVPVFNRGQTASVSGVGRRAVSMGARVGKAADEVELGKRKGALID